uniref:BZIP domain-containing protein n=1 Tax=Strongyloides stercoralis TaxID=6248 RepID=A0A0K0EBA1_STRER
MLLSKINLLIVFVLLFSVTVSLQLKNANSEKVIANNAIKENDLPSSLKNQKNDEINSLNSEKLETFTRLKRQSGPSRRRPQSSRGQQRPQRRLQNQLSPEALRRKRERERQRRRRIIEQRKEAIRKAQVAAATKTTTTTQAPIEDIDIDSLLEDDDFVDRLMERIHERMMERGPPPLPPPSAEYEYGEDDEDTAEDDLSYITISLQLKNVDSEKVIANNAIQENDLPSSLKNQKNDEINSLNSDKLETFTRLKRQSGPSRRRPQSPRGQQRPQRRPQNRLSLEALRRKRQRERQQRLRLIKRRREELRRARERTTTQPSTTTKARVEDIDIDSLLEDDDFVDRLMERIHERMMERGPPPRPPLPEPEEDEYEYEDEDDVDRDIHQ